jgi:hypothetical protein
MATLAKLLQVDMGLPDMAKRLAAAGRGKDSILAHINPKEMALLKKHGGSGKTNPRTGIMEFADEDFGGYDTTGYNEPLAETPAPTTQNVPTVEAGPPPAEAAPANEQNASAALSKGLATASEPTAAAPAPITPQARFAPVSETGTTAGPQGAEGYGQGEAYQQQAPVQSQPSFTDKLKGYSDEAAKFNKMLQPFAPYAKFGSGVLALQQGQQAANKQNEAAAANEAEVRKLAEPYRAQAEKIAQQGQQMLQMGQQGGLTAAQQQKLETQRAQAMQQQAQAGITGGTAAQATEAMIQRQASQFAQDNVTQGLQLISQAQSISGTADALIKQAISTGYTQSADASKLAADFYNALGFSLPETASKGPAQAQPQASTEAPVDLSQETP